MESHGNNISLAFRLHFSTLSRSMLALANEAQGGALCWQKDRGRRSLARRT